MTALYLLDTNVVIAALKGHPGVRQRLESLPLSTMRLSAIVLGELEFGVEKVHMTNALAPVLPPWPSDCPWSALTMTPRATMSHQDLPQRAAKCAGHAPPFRPFTCFAQTSETGWCARLGSNQQPLPSESSTLSIELRALSQLLYPAPSVSCLVLRRKLVAHRGGRTMGNFLHLNC